MKKRIGCFAALMLIFSISLSGCGKQEEPPVVEVNSEESVVSYSLVQATVEDVVLTQKIDCTYAQTKDQEVSFNVTGKLISRVYVKDGDVVKKGDLLCELSSSQLEEDIDRLAYNVKRNELQLGYYDMDEALDIQDQWVNATKFGTPPDAVGEIVQGIKDGYKRKRELLNDTLEFDREELARKRKELSDSRLYASMDGIVYKMKSRLEGSTSKAEEVVMTIVDNNNCLFEVKDTTYKNLFKDGDMIDMRIAYTNAAGDYVITPYEINNWTDKMQFLVVSGPDGVTIEVGATGTISITDQVRKQVLSIPKDVLHIAGDDCYVYTLNEENIREITYVKIGLYGDERVEITEGLTEGEKVVKK